LSAIKIYDSVYTGHYVTKYLSIYHPEKLQTRDFTQEVVVVREGTIVDIVRDPITGAVVDRIVNTDVVLNTGVVFNESNTISTPINIIKDPDTGIVKYVEEASIVNSINIDSNSNSNSNSNSSSEEDDGEIHRIVINNRDLQSILEMEGGKELLDETMVGVDEENIDLD